MTEKELQLEAFYQLSNKIDKEGETIPHSDLLALSKMLLTILGKLLIISKEETSKVVGLGE